MWGTKEAPVLALLLLIVRLLRPPEFRPECLIDSCIFPAVSVCVRYCDADDGAGVDSLALNSFGFNRCLF